MVRQMSASARRRFANENVTNERRRQSTDSIGTASLSAAKAQNLKQFVHSHAFC